MLAIPESSDMLAIGSIGDDDKGDKSGSIYVFSRTGNAWLEVQKLTSSDGAAGDNFGQWLALQDKTLMVGAPGEAKSSPSNGAA